MQAADSTIIHRLADWLEQGLGCWLCTVVETWGSSPRPRGSLMVINDKGQQHGSVSGGCVEETLIEQLLNGAFAPVAYCQYGADEAEAERLQLPCGGRLGILLERLDSSCLPYLQAMIAELEAQRPASRIVDFTRSQLTVTAGSLPWQFVLEQDMPVFLQQTIGPERQLFIIGISDVSVAVAELALWMGWQLSVCDPREDKIRSWPVAGCELLCRLPDEALLERLHLPELAIVALTHDPRIDDMGLLAAFDSQACYIGALGSQRTSQKRRERLSQLGISEQQLERLHAPVGLSIGSKRPREIAVAIMAQLTACYADSHAY